MVITRHFVFLHVPKTGGSFMRHVLGEHLPEDWFPPVPAIRNHGGWDSIPEEFSDLPVVAFVRNPWDWYVSWYFYLIQTKREKRVGRPVFRSAFGDGENDFPTTVRKACTAQTETNNRSVRAAMQGGKDFYTALVAGLLDAGQGDLTICRYETLVADFIAFLDAREIPRPPTFDRALAETPKVRSSDHKPYREHYDDETREFVANHAAEFIERYGYEF